MLGLKLKLGLSCVPQAGGGGEDVPAFVEALRAPSGDLPEYVAILNAAGDYWNNGIEAADPTDFFGEDDLGLGEGFFAERLSENGYYINQFPIAAIGDLKTMVLAGSTLVFEFTVPYHSESFNPCLVFDHPAHSLEIYGSFEDDFPYHAQGPITVGGDTAIPLVGMNKLALTIATGRLEYSLNGAAAIVAVLEPSEFPVQNAVILFHGQSSDPTDEYVSEFAAYEPQSSADLSTLSAIPAGAVINSVAPAISGTPQVGEILSCSTGTWSGTAPINYTYRWQVNSGGDPENFNDIEGATANQYTIASDHENLMIRCLVTATNAIWFNGCLADAVGPVEAAP